MLAPADGAVAAARIALRQSPPDPFHLFDLPSSFAVDVDAVRSQYFLLRRHFAQDAASLAAINAAYQTLIEPLRRADYLLALRGVSPDSNSPIPADCAQLYLRLEAGDLTVEEKKEIVRECAQAAEAELGAAFAVGDLEAIQSARQKLAYTVRLQAGVWEESLPS